MNQEEQLYQMIAKKRQLELAALKADNAVLRQSLRIWQRFQVYVENERKKPAKLEPEPLEIPVIEPCNTTDALRLVINGEPLDRLTMLTTIKNNFPKLDASPNTVSSSLRRLVLNAEVKRIGQRGKYLFTKHGTELILMLSVLCGCSTSRPHATQPSTLNYTAIMPRRMPDAPRPAETVRAIPTTVSRSLSWTHDPSPGLLTYRVDYGIYYDSELEALTNSLITSASNCTIYGLAWDKMYAFRVVGCDGRRYSELENLNLVIK